MVSFVSVPAAVVDEVFGYQDFNDIAQDQQYFAQQRYGCRLTRTSAFAVTDSTATFVAWTLEEYDLFDMHTTAQNQRITAPLAGVYFFWYSIEWDNLSTGGARRVQVVQNASTIVHQNQTTSLNSASNRTAQSGFGEIALAANDYLRLEVFQDSGFVDGLTLTSRYSPVFGARWVNED